MSDENTVGVPSGLLEDLIDYAESYPRLDEVKSFMPQKKTRQELINEVDISLSTEVILLGPAWKSWQELKNDLRSDDEN